VSRPVRFALPLVAGVAAGVLVAFTGTVGFVIVVVLCAALLIGARWYLVASLPRRSHKALLAELDPQAGPPAGAKPAQSDLLDRMQQAARAQDWPALKTLLADDFAVVTANGRRHGPQAYVRTLKLMLRAYPDLHSQTEAVLADPAEPNVLWLRSKSTGHAKRGPALDATSWSRLTTTADGERARELANGGVVRLG
jgi:hypothetical protein